MDDIIKSSKNYIICEKWLFVAEDWILYYVKESSMGKKFFSEAIRVRKQDGEYVKEYLMDVPIRVVKLLDNVLEEKVHVNR